MTALTQDKRTPWRDGFDFSDPVAAAAVIYQGALVLLDAAGNANPGTLAPGAGIYVRGVAIEQANNALGSAGAIAVKTRKGAFRLLQDGSVTRANIFGNAYVIDDATVSADGTGGRVLAGRIVDLDDNGDVWVDVGHELTLQSKTYLYVPIGSLEGAGVYNIASPVAGKITKITDTLDGVITTGSATLTAAIAGSPVTGGVVTHVVAGSGAGVSASAAPTGQNTVAAGQNISLTVGGTNASATAALAVIEITA